MNTTATKTTTALKGQCGHMGCTAQHDGAPWMFGIKLCWTHRLMAAGQRGAGAA